MENVKQGDEKKKGFGAKFLKFLACGGFFVILIGIVAIMVVVQMLMK
jgi:hypothetical protein